MEAGRRSRGFNRASFAPARITLIAPQKHSSTTDGKFQASISDTSTKAAANRLTAGKRQPLGSNQPCRAPT